MPQMNPTYTEIVPLTALGVSWFAWRTSSHPCPYASRNPSGMPPDSVCHASNRRRRCGCVRAVCVTLCQCNTTTYFKRLLCFLGEHIRIRASTHPNGRGGWREAQTILMLRYATISARWRYARSAVYIYIYTHNTYIYNTYIYIIIHTISFRKQSF